MPQPFKEGGCQHVSVILSIRSVHRGINDARLVIGGQCKGGKSFAALCL